MGAAVCRPRSRSDRCPGILRLHEAQDGALARVRLPGGRAGADQLVALADGGRMGSGIVEITSRANVQLRGLPADAGERLATLLARAGLLPSLAHERARNVLASPVAGRHPDAAGAVDQVVAALDRGLCADPALAALPGRFAFVVDDGSGVLAGRDHDVALTVSASDATLLLDGNHTGLRAPLAGAAELALAAARAFLAERGDGKAWRIRELPHGGAERVAARLDREFGSGAACERQPVPERVAGPRGTGERASLRTGAPLAPHRAAAAIPPGRLRQRDGRIAVTALPPLGRLDPEQLERLAVLAGGHGTDVRFSPWRTVTIVDLPRKVAAGVEAQLCRLGLVLDAGSGWHGLSACAGLGACARATADVRAVAAVRAKTRPAGAPEEHWTACGRRCGERAGIPVAVSMHGTGMELRSDAGTRRARDLDEALVLLAAEDGKP